MMWSGPALVHSYEFLWAKPRGAVRRGGLGHLTAASFAPCGVEETHRTLSDARRGSLEAPLPPALLRLFFLFFFI